MSELSAKYPFEMLIVEDNFINQKLIQKLFEILGYKTDLVTNGMEAVRIVEEKKYDLIFMDIQMPEMDGLEASILINERLGISAPVIIAMTANAAKSDKEICLQSGMSDYMSKPLKLYDLNTMICHWGELKRKPISDSSQN